MSPRLVATLALLLIARVAPAATLTVCAASCQYATVQAALNASAAGDVLTLRAGELFSECLTLPYKGVLASAITITTDAAAANLPAAGNRTGPAYAAFLPKIQSGLACGGSPAVTTAKSANHYTFRHVEFLEVRSGSGGGFNAIVQLGDGGSAQQFESDEPTDILIDQCYIHGGVVSGQKRGIEVHGVRLAITNNYIANIHSIGQDSQSIGGWNGHGPLTVTNNYLSGGTEPFMLGGGDARVRTLMTVSSGTATSAVVVTAEANHTLAELQIGQGLAVTVGGQYQWTTLRTVTGAGASGSLTFDALTATPDVGGNALAGVVLGMHGPGTGLLFEFNYVHNDPAWINGPLTPVTNVVGTLGTGALAPGTWYYTVQAFSTDGYQGTLVNTAQSAEVAKTLPSNGSVALTWDAVPHATSYRLARGTAAGNHTQYVSTTGTSLTDDGGLAWTTATPPAVTELQIKNLFEIKACQNAQVDSNIFENLWDSSANGLGLAWWLKTANQEGGGAYLQSKALVFEKNEIRHAIGFLEVHGRERADQSLGIPGPLTDLTVRNNILIDSGNLPWNRGHDFYAFIVTNDARNVTLDHNTVDHATSDNQNTGGGGLMSLDSDSLLLVNFVVTNNLFRHETYGIHDSHGADGSGALQAAAPGYTWTDNAVAEAPGGYPATTFSESLALWKGEFVAYAADASGDYHLRAASAYHNAGSDGKDLGADVTLVLAAIVNVVAGVNGPGVLPSPWTSVMVGTAGLSGSASYAAGVFTVIGGGADIFDPPDAFQFVYQPIANSISPILIVRITSLTNTSPFAKAGIMLRASTDASAADVILDVRPTNDLEFMYRPAQGAPTTFLATAVQAQPTWLRLTRSGNLITGSVSSDGQSWRDVGAIANPGIPIATAVLGMVVSSNNLTQSDTVRFDNVQVVIEANRQRSRQRIKR